MFGTVQPVHLAVRSADTTPDTKAVTRPMVVIESGRASAVRPDLVPVGAIGAEVVRVVAVAVKPGAQTVLNAIHGLNAVRLLVVT